MKSIHNVSITQNGILEILGASSSGRIRYNNNKLEFSNDSGTSWMSIEDVISTKVLVVNAALGNDTTGKKGSLSFPYKTITKAKQMASAGDLIYVLAGEYTDGSILKNNVDMYFEYGAVVRTTNIAIITDKSIGSISCNIKGYGSFISTGAGQVAGSATNHAIVITSPATNISIEASNISSYSIQGDDTTFVKIINAKIGGNGLDSVVGIGGSARLSVLNCTYENYNPEFVAAVPTSINNFIFEAINTKFKNLLYNSVLIRSTGTVSNSRGLFTFSNSSFVGNDKIGMVVGYTTAATNNAIGYIITLDNCKMYQMSNVACIRLEASVAEFVFVNDNITNIANNASLTTNTNMTILNKGYGRFYTVSTLKID